MLSHQKTNHPTPAIAWAGIASAFLVAVAARQLGLIRHLPDPPGRIWNSDAITSSKAAHPLGIPDGLLGLASYASTITLLLTQNRYATARRVLPFKLTADAGAAAFNSIRQVVTFRRLCSWCMGTALATIGMVYCGARNLRTLNLTSSR